MFDISEFICPKFEELNNLALKELLDNKSEDGKHRRAVLDHPHTCDHPHCMEVARMLKDIGFPTGFNKQSVALRESITAEKLK